MSFLASPPYKGEIVRFLSSRWFKIAISLGLFAVLLTRTDLRTFVHQLQAVRLELFLLAFFGYLVGQAVSAYKWQLLAQPLGFDQPLRVFTVYYFVGMYFNLFAPSTVAGDLGRGLLLGENKGGAGRALQSVLADRVSGLVTLLWVCALGFLVLGPSVLPAVLCYGIFVITLLTVISWWVLPHIVPLLFSPRHVLARLVEKVIGPYRERPMLMARVCGLSFLFHLFQLGLQTLLSHALGLTVSFWYLLAVIPLITILSSLPLSFNGMGVREGGYVTFLSFIGIGREEALAFGVLWTALLFAAGLFGGLVLLVSPEARFSFQRAETMANRSSIAIPGLRKTTDG